MKLERVLLELDSKRSAVPFVELALKLERVLLLPVSKIPPSNSPIPLELIIEDLEVYKLMPDIAPVPVELLIVNWLPWRTIPEPNIEVPVELMIALYPAAVKAMPVPEMLVPEEELIVLLLQLK